VLVELAVRDLGVIGDLTLTLPRGMIALTGETGAGKTLVVDAIELLMGARADPGLVRAGAAQASVDGRFVLAGEEVVLSRVIPAEGRSRAYIDGRPATVGAVAELGARLVDLHGQHAHQSLLAVAAQREALDAFGRVDLARLAEARAALAGIDAELAALGGDVRARAREIDLLRYQVDELSAADLVDADEDERLAVAEERLANATRHREAAAKALDAIGGDGAARDLLGLALAALQGRAPFESETRRLLDVLAEVDDLTDAVRSTAEGVEDDPKELERVLARRRQLADLCRKYGEDLGAVLAEFAALSDRLVELESHDVRADELDRRRAAAVADLDAARAEVRAAREAAAPHLAQAVTAHLVELAMGRARVEIGVDGPDGSEVEFRLAANPGSPPQPLVKVASGGELARTMLAVRTVLSEAPPVLVFDEVDAGIGGQAGTAVGRSLAALGDRHQVLVVTHLAQVAAFADVHLSVIKQQGDDTTVSDVVVLDPEQRRAELARMLSGQPDSDTARRHADELLAATRAPRSA
jgi:DNA repair protein RecN (Recombination protein N)